MSIESAIRPPAEAERMSIRNGRETNITNRPARICGRSFFVTLLARFIADTDHHIVAAHNLADLERNLRSDLGTRPPRPE